MKKNLLLLLLLNVLLAEAQQSLPLLKVAGNKRSLVTEKGDPFFWLGDTGWLLFSKLNREEAAAYLEDRRVKGFNVVQVMVLHTLGAVNAYGNQALHNKDVSTPYTTPGNTASDSTQYDFWDHVDYVVDLAATKGIYMAMVPVWGGNVKGGGVNSRQAAAYASFLANRYKQRNNIIWLNGGDIMGSDSLQVWKTIGTTINTIDTRHLVTFHPRGRTSSTDWFHNEDWLDFNMFQSGHRTYAQDSSADETRHHGEDNWKYVLEDYAFKPAKPTIDGEPSYEAIPYGLHDGKEPYWKAEEIRRYAYWSVFAGGFGFTYGHNAVMQFQKTGETDGSFFPLTNWQEGIKAPGAGQMQYLKKLMLSNPVTERIPDQSMVKNNGEQYNRVLATRGKQYAYFYTYNGRNFDAVLGKLTSRNINAHWFSPKDGGKTTIGRLTNKGIKTFDPPGETANGNDWVLVLEAVK